MGRHADDKRGRGLAGWLIGAGVALLVVVIAVVGYIVVMHRADSADQGVCHTDVSLSVVAGPSSAPALTQAATAYNATKPVVRSACVTARVTALADDTALARLTHGWPTKAEPPPGLWVPDSVASLAALDAVRPDLAAGHSTDPLAWSPVVLAMRDSDAAAMTSLAWPELATASGPTGTTALPSGRHLILALPPVTTSPASSYALQSVLAGTDSTKPADAATIAARASVLKAIAQGHGGKATTTTEALTELAAPSGANADAGNVVTAVPVVEADLAHFDSDANGHTLTAVHPAGSTVGDALIAAPISASWTDRTVTAAGSDFQAFLSSVPGQQILANRGWRTVSAHPDHPLAAVNIQAPVTMVPAGGPTIDQALAVALGEIAPPVTTSKTPPATSTTTTPPTTPSTTAPTTTTTAPVTTTTPSTPSPSDTGPVLTLIVDTSSGMSATDGGSTLMEWVKKALPKIVDGPITNRIGLWLYSDGSVYPPSGFPDIVPTGPINEKITTTIPGSTTPVTELRSKALTDAIASLKPDGDRWAYGALMEALPKTAKAGITGRQNRVILITSGADQTPGTLRRMVLDSVGAVKSKVRLDVIGLGTAVPVAAYTDIAAAGGGEYIPAPDMANLAQKITDLLTLGA
ncbi:MAG: substrate-binding domain-containing protein [Actinobacteria bacterium]|mgnify:FL=1|nr:substrate-binding domain-containing protein [Actinomycetota bacterium]